jgi:hypothetical protein
MDLSRISIEVTRRCEKACAFCYNHSGPEGDTTWSAADVAALVEDCAAHGVRAVSLGGGEPLEWPDLFTLLTRLRGTIFRSMTTNGLRLTPEIIERLAAVAIDKVHVSIHAPGSAREVERVAAQVGALARLGVASGVNLLVARSGLAAAGRAARALWEAGIGNDRIVYLPMRGRDTPSPEEIALVAGRRPFQSMTCLSRCAKSPRFAAIGWDRRVAFCSYTTSRRQLESLTHAALVAALADLDLAYCGEPDATVPLGRGPRAVA